jgi:hypothetical protein
MNKLLFIITIFFSTFAMSASISEETKNLSRCEGIYMYMAHLAQMQNNEGLAKNLLFRASNTSTAYLFLNESGGRVTGEIMEQIKTVRRADKPNLDANPSSVIQRGGLCDTTTGPVISKVRAMNKIWEGKDFNEWQQMIFATYLKSMGIR